MATLVFDGDCGFCTTAARLAERRIPSGADVVAYQHADLQRLGLTTEVCAAALQYIDAAGRIRSGADAVAGFLWDAGGAWMPLGGCLRLPGIRGISQIVYRVIARNRHRLPGGTPACSQHDH